MTLHYRARSVLYRFPPLSAAYSNPAVSRFVREAFFRFVRHQPVVTVELSSICNARCIFCSYPKVKQSGKRLTRMTPEVLDHVAARVAAEALPYISLTPTTGELLAHPGWADALERFAAIDTVRRIHLYTNAILLDAKAVDRLVHLEHVDKVVLSLSLGGVDRAGYAELFGVDRFDRVQRNVRHLLESFAAAGLTVPVSLEVRLTRAQRHVTLRAIRRVYGLDAYPHAGTKVRRAFDPVGGLVDDPRVDLYRARKSKPRPCQLLADTRYAADGSVWLCGCVMSEQPGDTTLRIGRYDDDVEVLNRRRAEIVARWTDDGDLPGPCAACAFHYLPDHRSSHSRPA